MIGDREHDIKGTLANGVRPIAVLWGYGSREELTKAGASVLCATPERLSDTLLLNTRKKNLPSVKRASTL